MENAAKRRWFVRGDVEMCLAPQRHAIFRHLTLKKWSEPVSFLRFWLENVLRATAACNFLTSQLPKWLRPCGVLCILTCKCASRHSGVQFFNIATSKMAPPMWCFVHFDLQIKCAFRHSRVPFFTCPRNSYLRTRRFSEPTFRTSGTTIHWENTAICDFTDIFRACWSSCRRL